MKTEFLSETQFQAPANQNRDNAIIGYKLVECKFFEELLNHKTEVQFGFKGQLRKYCSKCGNYQTPNHLDKCHYCNCEYDLQPKTLLESMQLTSHLKNGTHKRAKYVAAICKRKLEANGYTESQFSEYCHKMHGVFL